MIALPIVVSKRSDSYARLLRDSRCTVPDMIGYHPATLSFPSLSHLGVFLRLTKAPRPTKGASM